MTMNISRRESAALINSLTAGVVPRIGLRHIAVGRQAEVDAFLRDLATIEDGGAAFRFVSGSYGSGKSFLLQMIRNNAMEKGFVVMDCDLSPERRLTGSQKQGMATYRELMKNVSTKDSPEGGALESILQGWIMDCEMSENENAATQDLKSLMALTHGFTFSQVLKIYCNALKNSEEDDAYNALRWIRGEYETKTAAKEELRVGSIIDDQNWYEFLKLFAKFCRKAGHKGLVVFIDEGVNLYKINHKQSRDSNYEKILTIFNDTMQGKASDIGVFISGTPQFIYDERRGLFSYQALESRLSDSRFGSGETVDYLGPVIRLAKLSPEEIYILLERLCQVHGAHFDYEPIIGSSELSTFMKTVMSGLGSEQLLTPREIIRDFLGLLNILYQNQGKEFSDLVGDYMPSNKQDFDEDDEDGLFADFEL